MSDPEYHPRRLDIHLGAPVGTGRFGCTVKVFNVLELSHKFEGVPLFQSFVLFPVGSRPRLFSPRPSS
jgi:hypothetical protein